MLLSNEIIISCQVILRSSGDLKITENIEIDSSNIKKYLPKPETVSKATKYFSAAGFTVGHQVGVSFSITADVITFKRVFNLGLEKSVDGSVMFKKENGSLTRELPIELIPVELVDLVQSVVFLDAPDFGPSNF